MKLVKFITQSYLFTAFEFIFILRHIFCLPKKASTTIFSDGWLTSLFSANKLYYVVFLSFFCIQLFATSFIVQVFSGSGFFRVQVFQCPGFSGSGSRVWVQVLEVAPSDRYLFEISSKITKSISMNFVLLSFLSVLNRVRSFRCLSP